jgi:hypothetical protein
MDCHLNEHASSTCNLKGNFIMATLYGNNDYNKIYAGNNDSVFAQGGDDVVILNGSNAYIEAGSGNDQLYISGNNTTMFGGDGSDYMQIAGDGNRVWVTFQETGNDTLFVQGNYNQLNDSQGNGTATIYGQWNGYAGWGGNDKITVYGERNEIFGDKSAYYAPGPDTVGSDTITVFGKYNLLHGGGGNDVITVNGVANNLYGDAGFDKLTVKGDSNNVLFTGSVADFDVVKVNGGRNYIQATTADVVCVSGFNNTIDLVGFTGANAGTLTAYQTPNTGLSNTLIIENNHQDIVFLRQGNNLVIGFDDQAGQLTVVNQFAGNGYGLGAIKANDGFLLTAADLVNVTNALTAYDVANASVTFNSVAAIKASAYTETLIDTMPFMCKVS